MFSRIVITCLLVLVLVSQAARANTPPDLSNPEIYQFAQLYMLMLINRERELTGITTLRLDVLSCQVAKEHAEEMAANSYLSHWDLNGNKPSRRYNLQGGYHGLAENVYSYLGELPELEVLLAIAVQDLMDSPGHRKTILGSEYTHAGSGLALAPNGRGIYIAQEFTIELGGMYYCPLTSYVGRTVEFGGQFDAARQEVVGVVVRFEDRPKPRSPVWLNKTESYSDGEEFVAGYTHLPTRSFEGMETFHDMEVDLVRGIFRVNVLLDHNRREGMYYLMLLLRDRQSGKEVWAARATVDVTR